MKCPEDLHAVDAVCTGIVSSMGSLLQIRILRSGEVKSWAQGSIQRECGKDMNSDLWALAHVAWISAFPTLGHNPHSVFSRT